VLAAVIIIIFFIPYTASGFAACGKLFSSLFGMNYMTAMIISAVVIVAYTTAGGFFAASATDFVQSIIMTVAIVFVLVFSTISAGGIDAVVENAKALPGYLSLTASYIEDTGKSEPYNLLHIITTLSWGLGYFGMPHILLRFMAIEDEKKLKLSRRVASVWVVIAMAMAVLYRHHRQSAEQHRSCRSAPRQRHRDYYSPRRAPALDLRRVPGYHGGSYSRGYPCEHDVHRRLPASRRRFERVREHTA